MALNSQAKGETMAIPVESEVRSILRKNGRGLAFRNAYFRAWKEFEEKYPDSAWWRRKTTRAHLIWEYAVKFAIDALGDDVHAVPHHDTVSFIFDDKVLVRIKKADTELKSRNYPTQLALLFHEPRTDLFDCEGHQRVEIVYVLNQFETKIDWIGLVARENSKVLWQFELEHETESAAVLPLFPASPARQPADLARLKKDNNNDAASDNEHQ